jgi:hypothetical protein
MSPSRRDVLKLGGLALATTLGLAAARGQGPKRGGTLTIRAWDPPHFDPFLTISCRRSASSPPSASVA